MKGPYSILLAGHQFELRDINPLQAGEASGVEDGGVGLPGGCLVGAFDEHVGRVVSCYVAYSVDCDGADTFASFDRDFYHFGH